MILVDIVMQFSAACRRLRKARDQPRNARLDDIDSGLFLPGNRLDADPCRHLLCN
jgi:hypothetical protein